jgi:ABC-type enterochelin transport system substrate-binding protein
VEFEAGVFDVRIFVDVIDALGVKEGGTAFDAVNFVAFFEEKFREVGTVLAGDAGDECAFHIA